LYVVVPQKLDASDNELVALPNELSSLGKLKEVLLGCNNIEEVPVALLSALTALNTIDLSYQCSIGQSTRVEFPGSLLPILHPGLKLLDLRQIAGWGPNSLFHLGEAWAALSHRHPTPTLLV
jgi:hypothetical protein